MRVSKDPLPKQPIRATNLLPLGSDRRADCKRQCADRRFE
jgi:hypothetical protein